MQFKINLYVWECLSPLNLKEKMLTRETKVENIYKIKAKKKSPLNG